MISCGFWLTASQRNSLGKVSFTTDLWSDPDLKQYMAVTAHWLESVQTHSGEKKLTLRASLVGFLHLPGTHTGERLAEALMFIIKRTGLTRKVCIYFYYIKFS
jgi:hypothetical protein